MKSSIDYQDIDPNLILVVKELNRFKAVETIGSCGGHEKPIGDQWPFGDWFVKFVVTHSKLGWWTLEFLAWAINNDYAKLGEKVLLMPVAPPPYLNGPGNCLSFVIEGRGADPDKLADFLYKVHTQLFYTPKEWIKGERLKAEDPEDNTVVQDPGGGSKLQEGGR